MVKGVAVAVGITLLCLMIPVVHFISGPVGPFLGGFIGLSTLDHERRRNMATALLLGLWMALCVAVVIAVVVFVVGFVLDLISPDFRNLLIFVGATVAGYIWGLGTLGAVVSSLVGGQRQG